MDLRKDSKIYIAGHRGMVGSAMIRRLKKEGYSNIITRTSGEVNLINQSEVESFFAIEKPEIVVMAAAKVGGIYANNTYPADFMYENIMMEMNVIRSAYEHGVGRFLFLGSSCIYPRLSPQPMPEECLLTSSLEPTNEAYALAKISGLKYCDFLRRQHGVLFYSAMPTNLYGPGDNYHLENSHVMPAMIRRFHEAKESNAKEVVIWGTGKPRREFLHVDDLADGLYFLLQQNHPPSWINLGYGEDISILELAELVAKTVGYVGKIVNDTTKPDGTPRKLMDCRLIREMGWKPKIDLESGIASAYKDFKSALSSDLLRG